jgi:hypothetical protein
MNYVFQLFVLNFMKLSAYSNLTTQESKRKNLPLLQYARCYPSRAHDIYSDFVFFRRSVDEMGISF